MRWGQSFRESWPVLAGAAVAFGFAYAVNSLSLAWLWTDELGRPYSESLLLFWTWRLPLACGLGALAVGVVTAWRRSATGGRAMAVVLAVAAAAVFTGYLFALATDRSLRDVAALMVIEPIDDPASLLPFFNDGSDPAGVATEDPAAIARLAGCYDVSFGHRRRGRRSNASRPERVRLGANPVDSGWRYPAHPTLELEPRGAMAEFWFVANGSAVLVWSGGYSGRSMMIRPDGRGGFIGAAGWGDDTTPMRWRRVSVQRVPCG